MAENLASPEQLQALGLKPIDVELPCERCMRFLEEHKAVAIEDGECTRDSFVGLLADGKPRVYRFRQLSNTEWSTLRLGHSIPVPQPPNPDEPPPTQTPEEIAAEREWAHAIFRRALRAVRIVRNGEEDWQRVVIVPDEIEPRYDLWQLHMRDIDRGGSRFIAMCVAAILVDLTDGGPFGGISRPFPLKPAPLVSPTGDDVRPDAARVGVEST